AVEPDHALVRFVAVVVPVPAGRQHQVARLHVDALAVHGRVGAGALDDEPDRRGRMAVGAGALAGQQHLDGAEEAVGGGPAAVQARVEQLQRPPLIPDGNDFTGLLEDRLEQGPLPEVGPPLRLGVSRQLAGRFGPPVHAVRVWAPAERSPGLLSFRSRVLLPASSAAIATIRTAPTPAPPTTSSTATVYD